MNAPIRVMLVDDHTVVRAGLKLLINNQPDMAVIAEADRVDVALQLAVDHPVDIVLLDLSLPGGPSLPMVEQLLQDTSARVVVLTMHDDPAYARAALASGALGYVVKTIPEDVLLESIRSVHAGRLFVDLDDQARTAELLQAIARPAGLSGTTISKLSARELEVLRFLGQGLTNLSIAEQLDLSPKTVSTYRARIAQKMGLRSTADFVKFAIDTGLLSPGSGTTSG